MPDGDEALAGYEGLSKEEAISRLAGELEGRVWSAKIQAKKP